MEERARGSLLGLAWGDVLGCPVEGWRRTEIHRVYGVYTGLPEEYPLALITSREVRKRLRPLGLHSDDTQQALALANVCLTVRPWSLGLWAQWLVVGTQRGAFRGFGRHFQDAAHKLTRGAPPEHAGSASAGMGAAMRVAPLGALYHDRAEELARVAMESSLVTHGDIRAGALAFAIARTTALLISGATVSEVRHRLPSDVDTVETEWLNGQRGWGIDRSAGHVVSESIAAILEQAPADFDALRQTISLHARPHMAAGIMKAHPNQGFVLLGGVHALAMGLWPEGEPNELLCEIMRQGYDTDTVGAICGGILGARFGTGWIPLARLRDRRRLEAYADALVKRDAPPEGREAFVEREYDLTLLEKQFQSELLGLSSKQF
jgi:ADP-ribosyl-[dinitrogen reductase] hydrolase